MENLENNQQTPVEESGLSLKDLFLIIKKHIIVIISSIVIFTAVGLVFGKTRPHEYTASTTLAVFSNLEDSSMTTGYNYSNYITSTFVTLAKEKIVLEEAASRLGVEDYRDIQENLTASAIDKTLIIKLSYTSSSEEEAIQYVNEIAQSVYTIANLVKDSQPVYKYLYGNISPLSLADSAVESTKTLKYTVIGFAVGFVVAAAYVLIREMTDNKFRSTDEIEQLLGLPVLAGIPDYSFQDVKEGK